MKTILILFPILLGSFSSMHAQLSDYKLPETWGKDFKITLSYTGSMSGGSTHILFTHDSCSYEISSNHGRPKKKKFALKESDRVTILKKMHEFEADKIKSESSVHAVNDGWSTSVCFDFHCVEAGTSAELSDNDKNQFHLVYGYLENFAMRKQK